ncbi:ganglioside-induced differentiation-associated protein 1-like 1 [Meleagris gallopavo]|uniref:ganglioside-induced differentiation-associated protein 1-like 1 n=1 Tax=Meleagris gallopavo TaxID=9103 RepID=UPI00093D5945|nr:ganglioside-induced differentiation-associated protein 1-like 1 [Meleagris gallopavo]
MEKAAPDEAEPHTHRTNHFPAVKVGKAAAHQGTLQQAQLLPALSSSLPSHTARSSGWEDRPYSPSICLPPGHLANASTELMKLDHEEEPPLTEPYLSKQKKLMAKILEHDNVNYLKKILGELGMVLDQIEAELEKRKLEYQGQKCELWLCGCVFTLADILLGATLHRLKFLGLSKKYWEDGSRPNLQSFFDRIQKRFAFRKVLGDIHTTLLSAVVPNAFRLVKRKPPSFFGASFLMGSLGGMGYFAYWYLKKKYI